ncbi:hypothetical protein FRC10_002871 [Ceratobasidium sp. 414]|nr:hypothetical protein FRC10_002871 [Ceratobasidium sp. 414]
MFAAAAFLLSSAILVSADRSLSLKVTTPGAVITDVDNLRVAATVANTGSETLRLLRDPRSPLSKYPTETFGIVNANGARAAFSGMKVRYSPEGVAKAGLPNTIVELKPGESVTIDHNLAGVYNLTSTGAGAYTLDAANLFRVVEADNSLSDIYAHLVPATVNIKGKLVSYKTAVVPPAQALSKRQTYSDCTAARQTQVASAISSAASYATDSYSHLTSNPSGSTRYTRWFGTWASSRYSAVLNSFSAPATGAGSRADTIIHEGTHFTQVLGTDDYTYGQSSCLSLAKSNPTNAVYNAE